MDSVDAVSVVIVTVNDDSLCNAGQSSNLTQSLKIQFLPIQLFLLAVRLPQPIATLLRKRLPSLQHRLRLLTLSKPNSKSRQSYECRLWKYVSTEDGAEEDANRNFRSACRKGELQNDPDVVLIITLIKCINLTPEEC
jgi:hypothetical protein